MAPGAGAAFGVNGGRTPFITLQPLSNLACRNMGHPNKELKGSPERSLRDQVSKETAMSMESGIKIVTADVGFSTLVQPVVEKIDTTAENW